MSAVESLPMFDAPAPAPDVPVLSAGQRLTLRQKADIARGRHPLTRLPLHPEAPVDADPGDRGRPFTCGKCVHRVIVGHSGKGYPKCDQHGATSSAASDCRAWWPACTLYRPKGQER